MTGGSLFVCFFPLISPHPVMLKGFNHHSYSENYIFFAVEALVIVSIHFPLFLQIYTMKQLQTMLSKQSHWATGGLRSWGSSQQQWQTIFIQWPVRKTEFVLKSCLMCWPLCHFLAQLFPVLWCHVSVCSLLLITSHSSCDLSFFVVWDQLKLVMQYAK